MSKTILTDNHECLNKAAEEAREKIDIFIKAFNDDPDHRKYTCSIKAHFTENDKSESVWVTITSSKNDTFTGFVDNVPEWITSIKNRDVIDIKKDEIVDWLVWKWEGSEQKIIDGYFGAKCLGVA